MAFKTCPECGKSVRTVDPRCWNCEYDFVKGLRSKGARQWDASASSPTRMPKVLFEFRPCRKAGLEANNRIPGE
jgi:hypothetical protein